MAVVIYFTSGLACGAIHSLYKYSFSFFRCLQLNSPYDTINALADISETK